MSLNESMFGQYGVFCGQIRSYGILHPIYIKMIVMIFYKVGIVIWASDR